MQFENKNWKPDIVILTFSTICNYKAISKIFDSIFTVTTKVVGTQTDLDF